jgi:putative ABC transport system ATP-binding protein
LGVLQDVNVNLGTTVLIITHAAATADMADRTIHFSDGGIREVVINKTKLSAEQIEW